jgi:hypothetical protein
MVGFNYAKPMSGQTQTPPPQPPTPWYEQEGILSGGIPSAGWTGGGWADALSKAAAFQGSRYIPGLPSYQNLAPKTPGVGALGTGTSFMDAVNQSRLNAMDTGRTPFTSAGGQRIPTREEILAAMMGGGGGGGGSRPDFSAYRNALMAQTDELNTRIQAMYNALGEQAQANLGRIQDVYGGAQTGVGDIYGSATENIGQAFSSAQQQAADQMARLGIEAAAPQVLDPMALAQAQAVSGLETGRAGGLSALQRYGSTAQDFASQMGQVAQQQGTEFNAALLGALQQRLMDSIAAEQSGGGGGGGGGRGMSLRDQMAFEEFYRQNYLGEMPLDDRKFAFQQAQAAADPVNRFLSDSQARIMESLFPRGGGRPTASAEDLIQAEAATYQQLRQALGLG